MLSHCRVRGESSSLSDLISLMLRKKDERCARDAMTSSAQNSRASRDAVTRVRTPFRRQRNANVPFRTPLRRFRRQRNANALERSSVKRSANVPVVTVETFERRTSS